MFLLYNCKEIYGQELFAKVIIWFLCCLAVQDKLDQMVLIWEDIQTLTEEREAKLLDVMELAEKFWCDHMALVATIKDTQDFIRELEGPGVDPSVVKQQQEATEVSRKPFVDLKCFVYSMQRKDKVTMKYHRRMYVLIFRH